MFSAIGKYFRALGYLITGRIDKARKALSHNPAVVEATFDNIIKEKRKRIQQYKDAVAAMITQEEKKKAELKQQSEEVDRLEKLKNGAAAMAKKIVEKHGGDIEAVKRDPEYLKCQAAFKDFTSTLEEKESRIDDLETDIKTIESSIAQHKTQLQSIMREFENIKQEKHETVADLITAKEEREIADMISGISEDRTSQELQELRELRQQSRAGARVAREVAGMDTKRSEEEFLEYASQSVADDEFDRLIGLTKETEQPAAQEAADKTRIPEG
jgi:flagellar biosynthesis chaperone FliJ